MTYEQKYPNVEPLKMVNAAIMCGNSIGKCCKCGQLTKFIDINFEAYICSEECEQAEINELLSIL